MREIVVILGYGCDPNSKGMQDYLRNAADYIRNHKRDISAVIFTGSYTSPDRFPGKSEAGMMCGTLVNLGISPSLFILEEKAIDTPQNFQFTTQLILEEDLRPQKITVFGDQLRKLKIRFFAWRYLGHLAKTSFRGFRFPHTLHEILKQFFVSTPLDILSDYIPWLEQQRITRRQQAWGIKS